MQNILISASTSMTIGVPIETLTWLPPPSAKILSRRFLRVRICLLVLLSSSEFFFFYFSPKSLIFISLIVLLQINTYFLED